MAGFQDAPGSGSSAGGGVPPAQLVARLGRKEREQPELLAATRALTHPLAEALTFGLVVEEVE